MNTRKSAPGLPDRCPLSRLEKLRDDVLKGDVLDRYVGDRARREDLLGDRDHVVARDPEREGPVVPARGLAGRRRPWLREARVLRNEPRDLLPAVGARLQPVQRAVVDFGALVDDDDRSEERRVGEECRSRWS